FTQNAPAFGTYTTVLFNAGEPESLVGGQSVELDFRNVNQGATAYVNVNGFLGRPGQLPGTSANYVALSTTVGVHELGHLLGLRHSDSFGTIGINPATNLPYGIYSGLITRSVSTNETVESAAATGGFPWTSNYQFKYSPVIASPVYLAGNAAPVN